MAVIAYGGAESIMHEIYGLIAASFGILFFAIAGVFSYLTSGDTRKGSGSIRIQ